MPLLVLLLLLATGMPPPAAPEEVQTCREAVDRPGSGLMSELTKAMEEGGPAPALSVCREKAPAIAAAVSKEKGLTVRRTALRVRNPENRPDPWEEVILRAFLGRLAAGEDPANLEYSEIVEKDGKRAARYMRAIVTREFCLQCHGGPGSMKPEVASGVAELYPQDEAVGFKAGDLRGAFSVTLPLPPAGGPTPGPETGKRAGGS